MRRFVKLIDVRFFLLSGIVIFLLVLLGNSLVKLFERKQEVDQRIQGIEDKVAKLRSENESMNKVLQQAATPSFIEKEARRRLNMKKPGEKLVIIVPSKGIEEPKNIKTEKQNMGENVSWWQKIKEFFNL